MKTKQKRAFGGYAIDFAGRRESIEKIMGTEDLSPAEMTKRLWQFVREHNLGRTR